MTKQEKEALKLEEEENKRQFELAEKERNQKTQVPSKAEHQTKPTVLPTTIVERGVTDGTHYIAFDETGNIPESNKTVVVDWKNYQKTADGKITILE